MGTRMRWAPILAMAVAASTFACGGDGDNGTDPPDGITLTDLVGTWDATQVEYQSLDNPLIRFDLVALGGSLTLTVEANGDYTATIQPPGEQPDTETGSVTLEGNLIELVVDGVPESVEFDFTLVGNTLTMVTEDEEFDFDGDDIDDPARLTLVLVRRA